MLQLQGYNAWGEWGDNDYGECKDVVCGGHGTVQVTIPAITDKTKKNHKSFCKNSQY
jgi:hypothetical protein